MEETRKRIISALVKGRMYLSDSEKKELDIKISNLCKNYKTGNN